MLRYFCPIILAGGKSYRFGSNKVFFKINAFYLLDLQINFLLDFGFLSIYISGHVKGYFNILDNSLKKGPLNGIFTTYFFLKSGYYSHILFLPIDLFFFCKKFIFFILGKSKIFYSYYCSEVIFPFVLSVSSNVLYFLFHFCLSLHFRFSSLSLFFNFILIEKILIFNFYIKYFLNLNIYYNFFLLI